MTRKQELEKILTPKQLRFCHLYIVRWNSTQSAKDAGYSEKTACKIGSENIHKPDIKEYIQLIKDNFEENCNLSKTSQIKDIQELILNPLTDEKVRLTALAELNKMMGYNSPQKFEVKEEIDENINLTIDYK